MAETLKKKTVKGLFWGGLSNACQQLVGLVFGIILGRLLDRSDYGMIAMIAIFALIATELQNGGFRAGLINLKQPKHEDFNSVFWFNVVVSLVLYAILFFLAPLIADYYHQPVLTWLSRYVFLGFIFAGLGVAQSAWLSKNLQFKQLAQSGMIAVVISSITGAIMAWQDFGYWALATQNILFIATNTMMLWYFSSWRPTFHWDMRPVKRIFPFSVKVMLTAIFSDINSNVMNIVLGRHYSAQDTGDYNQAYQWSSKASFLIQGMIKHVDLPVLSGLQEESERQLRVLRKLMRFTAFFSFPLLFGLALVSHEFIVLTIGEKWIMSASLLPLLCISGAFVPISTLLADTMMARGRSDVYLWCTVVLGVLQIVLMATLWPLGIRAMVIAFVILNILWVGVWFFFVARQTGYHILAFLKDTMPFALAAAGVMVMVYFFTRLITPLWFLIVSRVLLAVVLYYIVMRLARVKILEDCQRFFLSKLKLIQ